MQDWYDLTSSVLRVTYSSIRLNANSDERLNHVIYRPDGVKRAPRPVDLMLVNIWTFVSYHHRALHLQRVRARAAVSVVPKDVRRHLIVLDSSVPRAKPWLASHAQCVWCVPSSLRIGIADERWWRRNVLQSSRTGLLSRPFWAVLWWRRRAVAVSCRPTRTGPLWLVESARRDRLVPSRPETGNPSSWFFKRRKRGSRTITSRGRMPFRSTTLRY